jgi:fructose-bisphosphate aldolase class I
MNAAGDGVARGAIGQTGKGRRPDCRNAAVGILGALVPRGGGIGRRTGEGGWRGNLVEVESSLPHHRERKNAVSELAKIARAMVAPGKESSRPTSAPTIKAFRSITPNPPSKIALLPRNAFTTQGAEEFISGVILFGQPSGRRLEDRDPRAALGILPGIKVDKGEDLRSRPAKVTEGLDGLRERIAEYRKLGARFAKWRAVINIGDGIPSRGCVHANAHALARYAALCIEGDLVPIVEPEVIMDGSHTIERCHEVTEHALTAVFSELREQRVPLNEMILKPNMVLSGSTCPTQASVRRVAEATLAC